MIPLDDAQRLELLRAAAHQPFISAMSALAEGGRTRNRPEAVRTEMVAVLAGQDIGFSLQRTESIRAGYANALPPYALAILQSRRSVHVSADVRRNIRSSPQGVKGEVAEAAIRAAHINATIALETVRALILDEPGALDSVHVASGAARQSRIDEVRKVLLNPDTDPSRTEAFLYDHVTTPEHPQVFEWGSALLAKLQTHMLRSVELSRSEIVAAQIFLQPPRQARHDLGFGE